MEGEGQDTKTCLTPRSVSSLLQTRMSAVAEIIAIIVFVYGDSAVLEGKIVHKAGTV